MPDHAPRAVQPLVGFLQGLHEITPGGGHARCCDALDHHAVFRQQLVYRRRDQPGLEIGKPGQPGEIE
jgi:hypothetical protein